MKDPIGKIRLDGTAGDSHKPDNNNGNDNNDFPNLTPSERLELAKLDLISYAQHRKTEAKRLGVDVKFLDREIAKARKESDRLEEQLNQTVYTPTPEEMSSIERACQQVEPWGEPVSAKEILVSNGGKRRNAEKQMRL